MRLAAACLLVVYFIAGLAFLGVRHWAWPRLDQWRPAIEARLASEIGAPVRLGQFVTDFDRLRPRLLIDGVEIGSSDDSAGLRLGRVEAQVSWRSLLAMAPIFSLLRFDAPRLDIVRLDRSRFSVSGLVLDTAAASTGGPGVLDWLLAQRSIRIQQARVKYTDARSGTAAEFADVDIAFDSDGERHKLRAGGRGQPASSVSVAPIGAFDLVADLERTAPAGNGAGAGSGNSGATGIGWTGQAYASFDEADVLTFNALAAIRSPLAAGRGRGRLWFEFAGDRPVEAHGEFDLAAPILRTADGAGRLDVLAGRVAARWLEAGGVEITTEGVELVDSTGVAIDAAAGEQRLVFDPDWRLEQARIALAAADADDLLRFARSMPLPAALAERISRWRVGGRIDSANLDWRAGAAEPDYGIDVGFSDLALALGGSPRGGDVPGFRGLSGTARLDPAGGRLALAGAKAIVSLPGVLEEADIPLDRYEARVAWRRDADVGLGVTIERFGFANADAAGEVHGSWRSAPRGPGVIDLEGRFGRADGSKAWRYLPLRLNAKARRWVRDAVRAGGSNDVRLRLRGDLADFPFVAPDQGEFLVTAAIESGRLAFDSEWPALEAVEGKLRFERGSMSFEGSRAKIFDVALGGISARIEDLDNAVLKVVGKGEGPLAEMIRVLRESPLRKHIGDGIERLRFDGPASVDLRLELPFHDIDASKVKGSVRLPGNRFEPLRGLPAFEAVRGELDFTDEGIAFEGLRANWLGGEIAASGSSKGDALSISGSGTALAAGLVPLVPSRLAPTLSGGFDYRGEVQVDRHGARVAVSSNLVGFGTALPAPLDKPAGSSRPALLEVAPAGRRDAGELIRLRIDGGGASDRIELLAETAASPPGQATALGRGALGIGIEPALPDAGFALRLRQPELDLDRWRELLASERDPLAGPEDLPHPDRVSLRVDAARIGGKVLQDLEIEATHRDAAWTARLHSRQADGQLQWRDSTGAEPAGTLVARFSRLEIPESDTRDFGSLLVDVPRSLPALDVRADRFAIGAMQLGALELTALQGEQARRGDWLIERLVLEHAAGRLEATGRWAAAAAATSAVPAPGRIMALDFSLAVGDSGRLLGSLGFPDLVRGGSGTFAGGVRWQGSPLAIDLPSLTGELRLDIGKGQFLRTEPGIAKLIGVLNLQSLPRRLNFDFRDVFAEGFAFDEIRGSAALLRGVARTEDLAMNGLQARVNLRGEVDLVQETQSLLVAVQPQVDAGLASLAYAAMVNPAVGIGSFIAQWVLRKPLSEMLATEFEVEGDWRDPQVKQHAPPAEAPVAPEEQILQ